MKLIATDELAENPHKFLNQLKREGSVVIVENGSPKGILTATSEASLLEDMQAQVGGRARRAVSEIRREAAKRGVDRLTMKEIDQEIAAARKSRRARLAK